MQGNSDRWQVVRARQDGSLRLSCLAAAVLRKTLSLRIPSPLSLACLPQQDEKTWDTVMDTFTQVQPCRGPAVGVLLPLRRADAAM
jgi:hypothetical protein